VNYPLIFKNIYYYQTDWNLVGLRFQIMNNQVIEYPLINIFGNQEKVWLTWLENKENPPEGIILIISNLEGYCSIYDNFGQFLGNLEINEHENFLQPMTFLEPISSTGLQIKTDPGISLIYSGFLFLMLSSLISYITYSQIWIIYQNEQIFIGGSTNRALFDFELEFLEFIK
jgi:cytochrome c biogenesis protein